MNKREFYSLFKPAFTKAYSKTNIRSGFEHTGLYPLTPSKVLNKLSTKQISRPSTSNSEIASPSNWGKMNQLIRQIIRQENRYKGLQLIKYIHQLQAENTLIKAKLTGIKEALYIEKKAKKPKKAVFAELRGENGNAAVFLSPAKISTYRDLLQQREEAEKELQAQKEQEKLQKRQQKEERAELKRLAAIARQEKRERAALERAQKKAQKEEITAQKEEITAQRLIDLQLSKELDTIKLVPGRRRPKGQHQVPQSSNYTAASEELDQLVQTTRSGRRLRTPQHLNGFQL